MKEPHLQNELSQEQIVQASLEARSADPALVVDMDGTLLHSDSLHEALLRLVVEHPFTLFRLPGWIARGKPEFKREVADRRILSATDLPYNPAVIAMVRDARDAGRQTALVSASDHRQVAEVARHIGLFDHVFGTGTMGAGGPNIAAEGKADHLLQTYGARGFDYVGDSRADLAVWKQARKAYAVHPSASLEKAAREQNIALLPVVEEDITPRWKAALKAMRPHQWSKNLLVLLPVLAAHDMAAFGPALAGLVVFSLVASCVYLLNDMIDLPSDRAHPRKCRRPFAAGVLSIRDGLALAGGLLILALILALAFTPPLFLGVLALYFATTFAYSIWLKRKLMLDVITLAGLYTLRIIGGSAATGIVLSPWLLAFSMFTFFSLAAIKRQAELVDLANRGTDKTAGRGYTAADLPVIRGMAITSGQAAVLVFALYVNSPAVTGLYARPELMWLVCLLLFYWLSRMEIMTHRGRMDDDPIVFAARDRISQICILLIALVVILASIGG